MPSSYTTRIRLEKQADGENANTWGLKLNQNVIDLVDEGIAGYETIALSGATSLTAVNGTTDQSRNFGLKFTGTLSADTTVTIPAQEKIYFVRNDTSGDYNLLFKNAGGTAVTGPSQQLGAIIATDGTSVTTMLEADSTIFATVSALVATSAALQSDIDANTAAIAAKVSVKFATSAGTAAFASSATNATNAVNATNATFASSATNATNAVNATNATNATNASSATFASSATNATNAVNASSATNATFATTATNATNAVNATNASNININTTGSSGSFRMVFSGTNDSGGNQPLYKDSAFNFYYNPSSNQLNVGSLVASSDVTAFSDKRLKDKITTLDGTKVFEMRGVSFVKDNKESSGVIAQELEQVAPELVFNDAEYKAVAYGNIVGYLIEAIKYLKKEIEELKGNK